MNSRAELRKLVVEAAGAGRGGAAGHGCGVRRAMPWAELREELDAWQAAGRRATLWWRDDGATGWTPALHRLLRLARAAGIAPALAVPPAAAEPWLADRLPREAGVRVLQQGEDAPADGPMAAAFAGSLCWGWMRLLEVFRADALPVLVPARRRIDPELGHGLSALGYRGLSMFGPRRHDHATLGLAWVNVHAAVVEGRRTLAFAGERRVLDGLVGHLRARRLARVDAAEPTGLLTRHLCHERACWAFLEELLGETARHPAVRWLPPDAVFRGPVATEGRAGAVEADGAAPLRR